MFVYLKTNFRILDEWARLVNKKFFQQYNDEEMNILLP